MEEILASIRRIISEEGAEEKETSSATQPLEEEDVLVLTENMMQPKANTKSPVQDLAETPGTPFIPEIPSAAAGPIAGQPVMPRSQPMAAEAGVETETGFAVEAEGEAVMPDQEPHTADSGMIIKKEEEMIEPELISAKVQQGSLAALAQLQKAARPQAVPRPAEAGLLVETLVRNAVEPMLRDWLENNLQTIVEQMVQREVERLGKKAEMSA